MIFIVVVVIIVINHILW